MSVNFAFDDKKTLSLFRSLEERLPDDQLAKFVVEIAEQLNFRSFQEFHSGAGRQQYSPAMLTALLFYGYTTGVFSSRKLEKSTYDTAAFQYITAGMHPDRNTIINFREQFSKELSEMFFQILIIAFLMGVPALDKASHDLSKIKENAFRRNALSYEYACELKAQLKAAVEEFFKKAEAADHADIFK